MKVYNLEQAVKITLSDMEHTDRFDYIEKIFLFDWGIFFKYNKRWEFDVFNDKWSLDGVIKREEIDTYEHGKYIVDPEDETKIYRRACICLKFSNGDSESDYFGYEETLVQDLCELINE